jgi:SulP family sulfate permease
MDVRFPVMQVLESSGFVEQIQPDYLIKNRGEAIMFLFQRLDHEYCRDVCTYRLFNECSTVKNRKDK